MSITVGPVVITGQPIGQGSMRRNRHGGMFHDNPNLLAYRDQVGFTVWQALPANWQVDKTQVWSVMLEFGCGRRSYDLDKMVRAVLDALTGVVWDDDRQVVCVAAARYDRQTRPGTIILLEAAPDLGGLSWRVAIGDSIRSKEEEDDN